MGGGQRHITEKLPLKIHTVEDIDVKMIQNDLKATEMENEVFKPCSVYMAGGVYVQC